MAPAEDCDLHWIPLWACEEDRFSLSVGLETQSGVWCDALTDWSTATHAEWDGPTFEGHHVSLLVLIILISALIQHSIKGLERIMKHIIKTPGSLRKSLCLESDFNVKPMPYIYVALCSLQVGVSGSPFYLPSVLCGVIVDYHYSFRRRKKTNSEK